MTPASLPVVYDPKALGARCDECILYQLRDGDPVPPEANPNASIAIVGEAPGAEEVIEGRPFVGRAGHELTVSIGAMGMRRASFHITNSLACRPPDNKYERVQAALKRINKQRKERGEAALPSPIDCCRPRLLAELARFDSIISMGGRALEAVTGSRASIMELRGGPVELWRERGGAAPTLFTDQVSAGVGAEPVKLLPTLHPAFVLRARRWTRAFRADLGRAFRWFTGNRQWREPTILYHPSPSQLREFFARPAPFFAYDVETAPGLPPPTSDGEWDYDPLVDKLRCIGFATANSAAVIGILSIDGITPFYPPQQEAEILGIIRAFLIDPNKLKAGWYCGSYDRMVIESQIGVTPQPIIDGLLLHKSSEPELPHNLAYAGSVYTDVHRWKAGHVATTATTDEQLHHYNAIDGVITAQVMPSLHEAVVLRQQEQVVQLDHSIQGVCVGMHRNGMYVDQALRRELDRQFASEAARYRKKCRDILDRASFNPASVDQVKDTLFEKWQLAPVSYSEKTGDPSTDDETLRHMLVYGNLDEKQRAFVDSLRLFRWTTKVRGTYLLKARPRSEFISKSDDLWYDEEETYEDRAKRFKRESRKVGLVWPDGRLRADWNQLPVTGRLASSHCNMQNIPRDGGIRRIFCAAPGRVLVGADMDQIELRFASAYWGARNYLRVFAEGRDPHTETGLAVFGERGRAIYEKALVECKGDVSEAKEHPAWKPLRSFAKTFVYGVIYGAEAETVHSIITQAEDKDGKLIYADISMAEVRDRRQNWLGANPEFEWGWETTVAEWRKRGFVAEPVLGRRFDFLDGEDRNAIVNAPVQSGSSAIVHQATIDFVTQAIPFQKWGPGTGIVQQGHDALIVEVPKDHAAIERDPKTGKVKKWCAPGCTCRAAWTARELERCMTRRVSGLDVDFKASAKIGERWSDL